MTDNNRHHSDLDRVSHQNSLTDFVRGVEERPRGGGLLENLVLDPVRSVVGATPYGKAVRGRTDFEKHDLNQMLDLVEQTDPEDLESSGKALWDARDAIKAAATELSGHIENVHWVGESGEAFRDWGRGLVTSTHQLSDFAGGAGDQITAAAVGLASVRKAMPPRDTRPSHEQKQPHAFPKSQQVDSNSHYAAAVQVEKHRQEAINQMNRLSSYYSVSAEQLKGLQTSAPDFKNMPDIGVPRPVAPVSPPTGGHSAARTPTGPTPHAPPTRHASVAPAGGHRSAGTGGPSRPLHVPVTDTPHLDVPGTVDTGTDIDSVGTLPPPVTAPATDHSPPLPAHPERALAPTAPTALWETVVISCLCPTGRWTRAWAVPRNSKRLGPPPGEPAGPARAVRPQAAPRAGGPSTRWAGLPRPGRPPGNSPRAGTRPGWAVASPEAPRGPAAVRPGGPGRAPPPAQRGRTEWWAAVPPRPGRRRRAPRGSPGARSWERRAPPTRAQRLAGRGRAACSGLPSRPDAPPRVPSAPVAGPQGPKPLPAGPPSVRRRIAPSVTG